MTILFVSLICQVFQCSPKRPPSTRRGRNIPRRITSGPISIDVAFFASKVCGQVQGCCFMITSGNKPLLTLSCATMILFVILCQFKPKHEVWSGTKEKNTFFTNYVLVLYWWPQRPTQSPHLGQKSDFLPKKSTFKANNRLLWQNLGYLGHLHKLHALFRTKGRILPLPNRWIFGHFQ